MVNQNVENGKECATEKISSIIFKEMEDIRMYGEKVREKLSDVERRVIGQMPLSQLKEKVKNDYPETITGQLKKEIDEIRVIFEHINSLTESLRQF